MYKFFSLFLLFFGASVFAQTHVAVSIAPQKFLVEKIGAEHVSVDVIVPSGVSSHTFEPTARQILAIQGADVWFRLGESFEERLSFNKNTLIVDQREGLELISGGCSCCHSFDPHIWLSPRLLKSQATQIAQTLAQKDPEHQNYFFENLSKLLGELDLLDQECGDLAKKSSQKAILVSHPAFGYFCRDYGYRQLSIEMEGREPTTRYLIDLLALAQAEQIQTVFLQKQHNTRGGKRVANDLGAQTIYIDPYAENVIDNLKTIAHLFATQ